MRLIAALSGGVDSAVAAARAVSAGHDVTGVHLALSAAPGPGPGSGTGRAKGCCTPDDARDARRAADTLGIPFYVWDLAERFGSDVVEQFVAGYAAGATPNPCLLCNERIKFAAVLDRARALGFDGVVTGHYARLDGGVLHRSADPAKDQSYVLGTLRADQLAGAVFPLADVTKDRVRAEAAERGLAVANKPDSSDICFVTDGDTAGYLRRSLGPQPGTVVDTAGAVVGAHDGAYAFTVGQRRGLRLAAGAPRYVLAVEPAARRVVVGTAEQLQVGALPLSEPVWTGLGLGVGAGTPSEPVRCRVQLRAHAVAVPATVVPGPQWRVVFDQAQRRVAVGQAAVFYDHATDTRVLGAARVAAGS